MKKLVLSLLLMGLSIVNVNAASDNFCTPSQISEASVALANTSYELSYASDYSNRVGAFEEGYMKLTPKGLPSNYVMLIYLSEDDFYELASDTDVAEIQGGVHKIEYYRSDCDTPVKSFEMKIPSYKLFCDVDKKCEENVWFDGTYENSASNQNRKPKETVSTLLIGILVGLILIIVLFVAIVLKRRRDREKGF